MTTKPIGVSKTTDTAPPLGATDYIEALADAWASIDGKAERFRACREDRARDAVEGAYSGYMVEAAELAKRLARRGFIIRAEDAP